MKGALQHVYRAEEFLDIVALSEDPNMKIDGEGALEETTMAASEDHFVFRMKET